MNTQNLKKGKGMSRMLDGFSEHRLDRCVQELLNLLQHYHQNIQLLAIGFLFLEMLEHLRITPAYVFNQLDTIRQKAKWHNIQSLRAAHLLITHQFKSL